MKTDGLNLDRISNLPQHITEHILTLLPIQEALRTSVLSTRWRYCWRSMPKLVFKHNMVEEEDVPSNLDGAAQLIKYKLVNAIFHVLLLHNGPTILEFDCDVALCDMHYVYDQIINYLLRGDIVKILKIDDYSYKLPISFFSLQGIEHMHLYGCIFEPPETMNGLSRLRSVSFESVNVSAKMLQRFFSNCPLLEEVSVRDIHNANFAGGDKFTFVDLFRCVPLIKIFRISKFYMEYWAAGGMPYKLPTSLVHLKCLHLDMCLMDQDELSSALCMIRSSPVLEVLRFQMYDDYRVKKLPHRQTPLNFLDLNQHSDLTLDHLKLLEIVWSANSPLEMEFVKLIMGTSPMLKEVRIGLCGDFSVDEEVKMLRKLVLLPFPRASLSAKLIIKRQ